MRVFVICSGSDRDKAKEIVQKLKCSVNDTEFLLLKNGGKLWKIDAAKKIRKSQMVVFIIGEKSHLSPYIGWELRKARKLGKQIVSIKLDESYSIHDVLTEENKYTGENEVVCDFLTVEEVACRINAYSAGEYKLFNQDLSEMDKKVLLEQYKIFLQTSETLISRRQSVNSFYITINSAMVTAFAAISKIDGSTDKTVFISGLLLSLMGIVLCISWGKILQSYGRLNASKIKVISLIEKQLPASLYDTEWNIQSDKLNEKPYVSFTSSEARIPKIYMCIYAIVILIIVIGRFVK